MSDKFRFEKEKNKIFEAAAQILRKQPDPLFVFGYYGMYYTIPKITIS